MGRMVVVVVGLVVAAVMGGACAPAEDPCNECVVNMCACRPCPSSCRGTVALVCDQDAGTPQCDPTLHFAFCGDSTGHDTGGVVLCASSP